jgi:hypothetical protein
MINYVVVSRANSKDSKVRYQGRDTLFPGTSPRMALRNWLNERGLILEPVTIYESYTLSDSKELVCWVRENDQIK